MTLCIVPGQEIIPYNDPDCTVILYALNFLLYILEFYIFRHDEPNNNLVLYNKAKSTVNAYRMRGGESNIPSLPSVRRSSMRRKSLPDRNYFLMLEGAFKRSNNEFLNNGYYR